MHVAQRLVGLSKQLKQIIQIEISIVKNPHWLEANQLAYIYKRRRKTNPVSGQGKLEHGLS